MAKTPEDWNPATNRYAAVLAKAKEIRATRVGATVRQLFTASEAFDQARHDGRLEAKDAIRAERSKARSGGR
jgi:hypothetical protein